MPARPKNTGTWVVNTIIVKLGPDNLYLMKSNNWWNHNLFFDRIMGSISKQGHQSKVK